MASTGVSVAIVAAIVVVPFHGDLTGAVAASGASAPALFVLVYVVFTLILVPGSALTIAGGLLFGPLLGGALAVVGGAIGATLAFLLGRRLGRGYVEQIAGARLSALDRWLGYHGVLAIAVVRIVPGVPYSLLNYAAGVTGLRTSHYIVGSALGLIPGGFAYAAFGGTLDDPLSLEFVGAVALVVGVLGIGAILNRRMGRGRRGGEAPPAASAAAD